MRLLLGALLWGLATLASAQAQVLPEIGIAASGTCRNITVRNPVNSTDVAIGCANGTTWTLPSGTAAANLGFTPLNPGNNLSELAGSKATARGNITAANDYVAQRSGLMRADRSRDEADLERISVREYCATVDGTTDNTTCIGYAITEACNRSPNRGGAEVYVPAGVYAITGTINVNCAGVTIRGAGIGDRDNNPRGTILRCNLANASTAPCILFSGGANYVQGGGISDLTLYNANSAFRGLLLWVQHRQGFVAERLYLWAPYLGIRNYAGRQNTFRDIRIEAVLDSGLAINSDGAYSGGSIGASQATRSDVIVWENIHITGASWTTQAYTCVVVEQFAATIYLNRVQCINAYNGLVIRCNGTGGVDACPAEIVGTALAFDFFYNRGIQATDFNWFECYECYAQGATQAGYAATFENVNLNTGWNVNLVGGFYSGAQNDCIYSQVGNTRVSHATVSNCNAAAAGGQGIRIAPPRGGSGDANGSNSFVGNTFCRFRSAVPRLMGGIEMGNVGAASAVGNTFDGCTSGVLNVPSNGVAVGNAGP